jgi:hypothetical protein
VWKEVVVSYVKAVYLYIPEEDALEVFKAQQSVP